NQQFAYNAEDDLTSVTDPRGLVTAYQRNGFSDLTSLTSPDTGSSTYTYDSGGNRKTSTDARGSAGAFTYDVANRPTSAPFTLKKVTEQTIAFSYDAGAYGKNKLTGASDSNHSLSWVYDPQGRVAQKTQVVGGDSDCGLHLLGRSPDDA